MALPTNPHLDLPYRLGTDGHPVTVEQDSVDDIANCVEAALRTAPGERDEAPAYGARPAMPDRLPLNLEELIAAVERWEPRARLAAELDAETLLEAQTRATLTVGGEA